MRQAPGSHFLRSFYSACLRLLFYLFSPFFPNTFQTKSSYLERRKGARKATIRQPPYHRGNFRTPHCFRKAYLFQTILLHRSCIWQVPKLSIYLQINFQCLFFSFSKVHLYANISYAIRSFRSKADFSRTLKKEDLLDLPLFCCPVCRGTYYAVVSARSLFPASLIFRSVFLNCTANRIAVNVTAIRSAIGSAM